MFAKYHYLSYSHNNAAKVYLAIVNDIIVGFLSVLHFPHPRTKKIKRVHRLVILPDFQGAGIGIRFLEEVGKEYKRNGFRYRITTSQPALLYALKKRKNWITDRYGRMSGGTNKITIQEIIKTNSKRRITASFELK